MSSVGGTEDTSSAEQKSASSVGRMQLSALMDVIFGGAALALLLIWLVVAIAGGQLT